MTHSNQPPQPDYPPFVDRDKVVKLMAAAATLMQAEMMEGGAIRPEIEAFQRRVQMFMQAVDVLNTNWQKVALLNPEAFPSIMEELAQKAPAPDIFPKRVDFRVSDRWGLSRIKP